MPVQNTQAQCERKITALSCVKDYDFLYANGASAILGPDTVIQDSAKKVMELLLDNES